MLPPVADASVRQAQSALNGTTSVVRGANVTIDTSAANSAPEAVYHTYRDSAGSFSYVIKANFIPDSLAYIQLHFAEIAGLHAGGGQFNVTINNQRFLTNFDIYAAAGNKDNKAVFAEYDGSADLSETYTITFSPGAAGYPIVQGVEVLPVGILIEGADANIADAQAVTGALRGRECQDKSKWLPLQSHAANFFILKP